MKMKIWKRIASLAMALVLVAGLMPGVALKADAAANDKLFFAQTHIYAQGNAITIEAGTKSGYTKIKVDSEYVDFSKCKLSSGAQMYTLGNDNYEADLSGVTIRGAGFSSATYNTSITMYGGTVKNIYGSCATSTETLTGSVTIEIHGGTVKQIVSATYGHVSGNATITMTGGKVGQFVLLAYKGNLGGDGNILILGGTVGMVGYLFNKEEISGSKSLYAAVSVPDYSGEKETFDNYVFINGSAWKFGGDTVTALNGNKLRILEGQTVTVDSGKTFSGFIYNYGTITVNSGGTLAVQGANSGTITIKHGGRIEKFNSNLTNIGTIYCYGTVDPSLYIELREGAKVIKKVTASGTNLTVDDSAWQSNTTNYDDDYTATLTANAGYKLPDSVTVKVGSTTLAASDYTYNSSTGALTIPTAKITADTTVTATGLVDLSSSAYTVTLEQNAYTYTGSPCTPAILLNGSKLSTDYYTATYTNNINQGTATVTVTGKNGYTGTKTLTFTINKADISGATVTLSPTSGTYSGSKHTAPAYTLTFKGKTLTAGTDYTAGTWSGDLTSVGEHKLVLTGKGNFSGQITLTYTIGKATPTASQFNVVLPQNAVYNGTAYSAAVTSNATGMGAITVKYNGSTTVPTNAGTYKVTVDVAAGSNYNAASGIELGSFTIAPTNGTASVSVADLTYGEAVTPVPVSATNGTNNVTYLYKVKGAEDSTYTSTVPTAAGEYTVKATFAATGNYKEATATADFTISKRSVTVTANNASKTYGGTDPELTWTVTNGIGEELAIAISRAEGENTGDYDITVSQNDGANPNYDITFVKGTFTINKATLTVTAENKTAFYGDTAPAYTVTYAGFGNGDDKDDLGGTLAFACDYEQFDDKGTYTITPSGLTSGNYDITFVPGTLTVGAKEITVTIAGKTSVYGDEIVELTADDHGGIVNNDTNVYSLATTASKTADAGKYDITGTALDGNYSITFVNEEDAYEITARELTVSVEVADKKYDGLDTATITSAVLNNVANEDVVALVNGTATFTSVDAANGIGIAFTDFTLSGEEDVLKNYTLTQPTGIQASITNDWTPTEYTVTTPNSNGWLNSDFVITAESGYKVSLTNTADGAWVDSLTYSEETDNGSVTFYLKNEADGTISLAVTESYKLDKTVPTGTVSIDDNEWRDLWNTLTFGLFFKETKTVKVVPEDTLSGIAKAEYYDSAEVLTAEQVKAITAWTDMGEDFSQNVTAEDAKTFIYYIRITDNAGNVTYISTADATYDLTAPAISGITDGSTYYTTQKVTVTDTNLATVTLNGEAVTGEITLEGNKEATYTIVATDKAGNETTCTVTMKPVATISAPVDSITESNVNSGNADVIAEVEDAAAAVDTANATEEEKAAIKAITDKCDALQEVIADTAAEYERITDAIDAYDPEEVTSDDKADLDKLAEDLEALVESGNLTEAEKAALETPTAALNGMIETVTEVAEEADRINDAVGDYALETVKSSDKDDIEQLIEDIDALLDTDNLTDEERSELEGLKTKCENLIAMIDGTEALIGQLEKEVDDLDAETIKSTDKAALEQIVEDAQALIDGGNVTEAEKEALKQIQEDAQALIDVIDDTAAENKALTDRADSFDEDTVKSDDKADLEQLVEDIDAQLETENLTDEERNELNGLKTKCENLIAKIDGTEALIGQLEKEVDDLDAETIKSTDKAALEQVIEDAQALIDGGNVTEAEKEALKQIQEDAQSLIDVIDDTAAENKALTDRADSFNKDTVKSTDKDDIEQLVEDIDAQLETENLTDEERNELNGLKTKCENLIAKIDGTEALIGQLEKEVDDLDAETIKSTDKAALEQVIEDAQALIDSGNVTEAEKEALKQIQEDAQALIDVIDDTAAENKALTDQADSFDEDTVKSADKAELEQLGKDIEALLDTKNLTEDERAALEDVLEQVNDMIETIEDTAEDSKAATDAIDALDPSKVTSNDTEKIEQVIKAIDELLKDDHLTDNERKALKDAKKEAEALIAVIDAAQDAADTENTEKVENVTAENVKPEDKTDLENGKADLEKALEDNAGNYTEEEKKAIQDQIQRIEDAIEALENVEKVTETVTQLPETAEPDDEAAAEKILDAKKAYDELTDHEKSLVDETTKKKLEDLVAALTAYDIIEGDGGQWTKGSSSGLSFTVNGPLGKFVGIEADGVELDSTCYTAESGSTVITLNQSFLEGLSTGEHTITVRYTDGETSGTFTILAEAAAPEAGGGFNIMLWLVVLCVCVVALILLLAARKRRRSAK